MFLTVFQSQTWSDLVLLLVYGFQSLIACQSWMDLAFLSSKEFVFLFQTASVLVLPLMLLY